MSSQFWTEDYSLNNDVLSIGTGNDIGDNIETAIGGYFRIKFPTDWPLEERYDFQWGNLRKDNNPIDKFNYDKI